MEFAKYNTFLTLSDLNLFKEIKIKETYKHNRTSEKQIDISFMSIQETAELFGKDPNYDLITLIGIVRHFIVFNRSRGGQEVSGFNWNHMVRKGQTRPTWSLNRLSLLVSTFFTGFMFSNVVATTPSCRETSLLDKSAANGGILSKNGSLLFSKRTWRKKNKLSNTYKNKNFISKSSRTSYKKIEVLNPLITESENIIVQMK